jgi:hypothetical protein
MDLHADRQAYTFAHNVLQAAAPNAIVLSRGDSQTFSLWYVRYGLRQRPDVIVVDRYLLAFDWYRADLSVQHPDLAPLVQAPNHEEAAKMLVLHESVRPIHLTYRDDLLFGISTWVQEGPLSTLVR